MADRTDPPDRPALRGPWPEVTEPDQIFDEGAPWCANADGHPEYDYPDPEIHVPPFECRTAGLVLDANSDLVGRPRVVETYVARPFRFGQPREAADPETAHLTFEVIDADGAIATRFMLTLGDGLRLARHLLHLIDIVDHPPVQ